MWKASLIKGQSNRHLKEAREGSMKAVWERSLPGKVKTGTNALRQESVGDL